MSISSKSRAISGQATHERRSAKDRSQYREAAEADNTPLKPLYFVSESSTFPDLRLTR
jgi:hypothetical protein